MKTKSALFALLGALMAPSVAQAEEPICALHQVMPIERQLRRMSLVVRGHIPTYEELLSVEGQERIGDEMLDAFVQSDGYRQQMRRFHEQLLWPNPTGARLQDQRNRLRQQASSGVYFNQDAGRRSSYRGGNGSHVCQDVPQSTLGYETDGTPVCEYKGDDQVYINGSLQSVGWCQDGYELHNPYWDPASTIKVCAFEAQQAASYQGATCDYLQAGAGKGCGCGPDLRFCSMDEMIDQWWADMREQLLLVVDDHTDGSAPYSELLTTKSSYVNGRLAHFKKHLAQQASPNVTTYNVLHSGDADLSAITSWDAPWTRVERGGIHSGILTLPAFTLRFQTGRGRANRFRIAFTDRYFVPASEYETEGCDPTSDDLTERCDCRVCHLELEPMAMHFAQVAERGSGLLSDFYKECPTLTDCLEQGPAGPAVQARFYKTDYSQAPARSFLAVLEHVDAHPEYDAAFDAGPAALVADALAPIEGKTYSLFSRAIVSSLFKFVMSRPMNLDASRADNEIELLEALATELTDDDDFAAIVRRLVRLDTFRRTP